MKLTDLKEYDSQLAELTPMQGPAGSAPQPMPGSMIGQKPSGLAGGQMDPAQAAMAVKQRQEQKKSIQDAIKQKQKELADLQKQLSQIG